MLFCSQFIAVLGGSFLLDVVWFVSNSTHGFARLLILLNLLLKVPSPPSLLFLRFLEAHSPLSAARHDLLHPLAPPLPRRTRPLLPRLLRSEQHFRPHSWRLPSFRAQAAAERDRCAPLLASFKQDEAFLTPPCFAVFQQPSSAPGSYQQPRFSLDEDLEAGAGGSGTSTPSTNTATGTNPLFSPPPSSAGGAGKKGGKKGAAGGVGEERPAPPYRVGSTTAAEGGGYHSLE